MKSSLATRTTRIFVSLIYVVSVRMLYALFLVIHSYLLYKNKAIALLLDCSTEYDREWRRKMNDLKRKKWFGMKCTRFVCRLSLSTIFFFSFFSNWNRFHTKYHTRRAIFLLFYSLFSVFLHSFVSFLAFVFTWFAVFCLLSFPLINIMPFWMISVGLIYVVAKYLDNYANE